MKIVFIRHGDPDYINDTLTERGIIEAEALAKHIDYWNIDDVYLSPLGRAQDTAKYSLNKLNLNATTYDWLREFNPEVIINENNDFGDAYPDINEEDGTIKADVCWDIVPGYLKKHPEYYENPGWKSGDICTQTDVLEKYELVCNGLDAILAKYGYIREGSCYKVEKESEKTIAIFCHFGVICVMLSYLINVSPFSLWHGLCIAPSAVTLVKTEERQQGIASFRTHTIGDISHLIMEKIEPSPAASFTEVFSDNEARH